MTPEQKEKARLRQKRYEASPKGKAKFARYRQTEGYRAAQERHKTSERAKSVLATYVRKNRAEKPEAWRARSAIGNAIRSGRIVRPAECQDCKQLGRIEAHHHRGYAPDVQLDVLWLCSKCHKRAHGRGVMP